MKVTATITAGMPVFEILGLPDLAVREARVRVRSAIRMAGLDFPRTRVVVEVTDAYASTANDLPIALAVLKTPLPQDCVVIGELALTGDIRACTDVMRQVQGAPSCIVPYDNYWEAKEVCPTVWTARSLRELVDCLAGLQLWPEPPVEAPVYPFRSSVPLDMSDVRGHSVAKRAMEVAAVGGHNLAIVGTPGVGKTMLARRLPTIMAPMTREEAIETSMIHSEAGLLPLRSGLLTERPFRAPHHTCSSSALIGGGTIPRPGEVSLAHNGVLYLDELLEFPRMVLEVLREPLEAGTATVTRARTVRTFPAKCQVVAALNPCLCGHRGGGLRECGCSPTMHQRYWQRLNAKVVESFDIWIAPLAIDPSQMRHQPPSETSETIRARVVAAKARRTARGGLPPVLSESAANALASRCPLPWPASKTVLRVAESIADLDGCDTIESHHIAEALSYRRPNFTIVAGG